MPSETQSIETLAAAIEQVKKDIAELRAELRDMRNAEGKRARFGGPFMITSVIVAFWILYWLVSRVSP